MGWTPDYFWRATIPEFWCGVDWIAERNLDAEEQIEEAKAEAQTRAPRLAHKAGSVPQGGERVRVNPNLRVVPNPAFVEWRERLRAEHGI